MLSSKQKRPKLVLTLPSPDHAFPLPLPQPAPCPYPLAPPPAPSVSLPQPLPCKAPASSEEILPDDTNRLELLGYGSSGKVYSVEHKKTGRIYALKIIQELPESKDLTVKNQIIKEMQILQRANHPNVVRCYGSSYKPGEISFVLEYMGGGSLADVLKVKKVLPESFISEVARQVLQGLSYLHREKIVHRDIKPSNLLINRKQEVKIADFGVSTVLASSLDPCSSFVGTCAYMCPERFDPDSNGGNYNGYAADTWSVGLSLLECATGHFPFLLPGQRADWPTLMYAICYGDAPSLPANASAEFKSFIKHCLQKDASRRLPASALLSLPFITKYEGSPSAISALLQSLKL